MMTHGTQEITDLRRGTWQITSMTRGTFDILGKFFSPYSVAATAALKAAFPTQWETIRDYGWQHPALVPFINEDPMLVMSLIEGLGTRWLVGDGTAFLQSDVYIKDTWRFETDIHIENTGDIFEGLYQSGESTFAWGRFSNQGYVYFIATSSGGQPHPTISSNTDYTLEINGTTKKFILNGTSYNLAGTPTGNVISQPFSLFVTNEGGSYRTATIIKGKRSFAKFYDENGVLKDSLVPCKHKVNGVLKAGMLDLETAHWFGNANIVGGLEQGSFTISETPSA